MKFDFYSLFKLIMKQNSMKQLDVFVTMCKLNVFATVDHIYLIPKCIYL